MKKYNCANLNSNYNNIGRGNSNLKSLNTPLGDAVGFGEPSVNICNNMKSWKSVNAAGWYCSVNRKQLPKIVVTVDGLSDKNMQVQSDR